MLFFLLVRFGRPSSIVSLVLCGLAINKTSNPNLSSVQSELVNWINTIQSESMKKISFYKLTTLFAEFMKKDSDFESVQVTGHSLGGGLSMITGAQAQIPAIGLSGPNALISGKSFNPPVSKEDMNKVCCIHFCLDRNGWIHESIGET